MNESQRHFTKPQNPKTPKPQNPVRGKEQTDLFEKECVCVRQLMQVHSLSRLMAAYLFTDSEVNLRDTVKRRIACCLSVDVITNCIHYFLVTSPAHEQCLYFCLICHVDGLSLS